jgi:hypothetical protein
MFANGMWYVLTICHNCEFVVEVACMVFVLLHHVLPASGTLGVLLSALGFLGVVLHPSIHGAFIDGDFLE